MLREPCTFDASPGVVNTQSFEDDLGDIGPTIPFMRPVDDTPFRLLGRCIMTAIVVMLAGYIALSLFYLRNTSWLAPARTDDARVIASRDSLPASSAAEGRRGSIAFVPQANLASAQPGTALYACRLQIVWCRRVGTVLNRLPGEVHFKHPQRDATLRGQMVEVQLADPAAARADLLFAGGPPLGL